MVISLVYIFSTLELVGYKVLIVERLTKIKLSMVWKINSDNRSATSTVLNLLGLTKYYTKIQLCGIQLGSNSLPIDFKCNSLIIPRQALLYF